MAGIRRRVAGIPADLDTDLNLRRWHRGWKGDLDAICPRLAAYIANRRAAGYDRPDFVQALPNLPVRALPILSDSSQDLMVSRSALCRSRLSGGEEVPEVLLDLAVPAAGDRLRGEQLGADGPAGGGRLSRRRHPNHPHLGHPPPLLCLLRAHAQAHPRPGGRHRPAIRHDHHHGSPVSPPPFQIGINRQEYQSS